MVCPQDENRMTAENHPQLRTKIVGVRVTDDDFELLQSRANAQGKTLSEWCRDVLLQVARNPEGNCFEQAMVGEMMALRTIITELNYYYVAKTPLTFDSMKAIWKKAEESKRKQALNLLRQVSAEKDVPPPQKGWSR
jgi:hypothetical protein